MPSDQAVNKLVYSAAKDRHHEKGQTCVECGSHVSTYNANSSLIEQRPEAAKWDWWVACDNAHCQHAYGEGLFQIAPDWIKEV